jgi:hypothetical protein
MIMRRLLFACATAVAMLAVVGCEDVIGPVGNPVDLSYKACAGSLDNPEWFAVQDGAGSWQRVTASASGSYDFQLSSGKGGIAIFTEDRGLFFMFATTEEFQANLPACNGSVRDVSGSVTGYATADNVQFWLGNALDVVFGSAPAPQPFLVSSVDATATDLIAVRYRTSSGNGVSFQAFPSNVFIRRNVTGSSTNTVDFSSSTEAGAPLLRSLNVTNLSSGEKLRVVSYLGLPTTVGSIAAYETDPSFVSGSVVADFYGIPSSRLAAGETQMIFVEAEHAINADSKEYRAVTSTFTDPTDRSISLGPTLGTVSVAGTSRPSASYNVQAAYDNIFDVVFSQGSGTTFRQAEVVASSGYFDGASSVTLSVPNLSGVSGFLSSWLIVPGVATTWDFVATDADYSVLTFRPATYQRGERYGLFTP